MVDVLFEMTDHIHLHINTESDKPLKINFYLYIFIYLKDSVWEERETERTLPSVGSFFQMPQARTTKISIASQL